MAGSSSRSLGHNSDDEVYSITTASTSYSDELSGRVRRYVISMSIRTACFVGAILTDGPLRWALIVGAVALPYFAVIIASTGVRTRPTTHEMNTDVAAGALESGHRTDDA